MTFNCKNCNHSRGVHASPLASVTNVGPCSKCDCGEYVAVGRHVRPYMFPFIFMFGLFIWMTLWSMVWFANPSIPDVPIKAPSEEYAVLVIFLIASAIFAKRRLKKELIQ